MKIFLLYISLSCLFLMKGLACSCGPESKDFYETISFSSEEEQGLFVLDSMSIEYFESVGLHAQIGHFILIDNISQLDAEIPDTIVVLGQDGFTCNKPITDFEIGDTLILSLSNEKFGYETTKDTFSLKGCNTHYLEIKNRMNSGISYEEIRQGISDIVTSINEFEKIEDHVLDVYPNPCQKEIFIEPNSFKISSLELLNHKGVVLKNEDSFTNKRIIQLDVENLSQGHYYLRVKDRTRQEVVIIPLVKE